LASAAGLGNGERVAMSKRSFLALSACAAILSACAPTIDARGNLPDPDTVLQVQPGIDGRAQVAKLLGSPSTVATFNDKTWYYISKKTSRVAFWDPEVLDQEVLMVKFDDTGLVSDMKVYGLEDAHTVTPDPNITPTSGRELTIVQQLLGNLGRFGGGGGGNLFSPGGAGH
jgi:outer membrane protein assembly factor BamE (lipoprotein component of BamABCDE complex)